MTLTDISHSTGLSISFLSQVERGKCDITLMSLGKIAHVLGVDIRQLFEGEAASQDYYRPLGSEVKMDTGHSFLEYYQIASDFDGRAFDAYRVVCHAHAMTEYKAHDGEEFIYVLSGEATVTIDGHTYEVKPGETIHYPSTIKHILGNNGSVDMEAIIVTTQLI